MKSYIITIISVLILSHICIAQEIGEPVKKLRKELAGKYSADSVANDSTVIFKNVKFYGMQCNLKILLGPDKSVARFDYLPSEKISEDQYKSIKTALEKQYGQSTKKPASFVWYWLQPDSEIGIAFYNGSFQYYKKRI